MNKFNDVSTPLHKAVFNHNSDIARLLLENGANPNILSDRNYPPLYEAVILGYVEIIKLFRDFNHAVDINRLYQPEHSYVPMSIAPKGTILHHLLYLYKSNWKDYYYSTNWDDYQLRGVKPLEALLQFPNLNIELKNARGETAMAIAKEIAEEHGGKEIRALLHAYASKKKQKRQCIIM